MKHFAGMTTLTLILSAACSCATLAQAGDMHDGYYLSTSTNSFEDVIADLQDSIINQGLVIDYNGHTGDMLERTADALDTTSALSNAEYFNFCSARLTHAAVAASPENMAICPYVVFAYQLGSEPDTVHLGYRRPMGAAGEASEKALADIDDLLQSIIDEASE
jgi:hypothetical protein